MVIHSRPNQNRWALTGGVLLCFIALYGLIDAFYKQRVPIDILVFVGSLCLYLIWRSVTDLYISFFKSPARIELKTNVLIIKMPFGDIYSVNVATVEKVTERRWKDIAGFYNAIMSFSGNKGKLFFDSVRFEGFEEFLRELKKANPACQIDESLM